MAQISRKYDFQPGQKILSAQVDEEFDNLVNAHNVNDTEFDTHKTAVVIDHPDASVTTVKIADNAVTTTKIPDSNVTTSKISNSGVTTAKIADGAVTEPKIANGAITALKYGASSLPTDAIASSAVTTAKLANAAVTIDKADTTSFDGRYYTETEVDALLTANVNGDHLGTWQGLTPGEASEAINGARLDVVEADLNDTSIQTSTIPYGLSTITTDQKSPLAIEADGRTVINNSPLFDSGLWTIGDASWTTDSDIKATLTVSDSLNHTRYVLVNVKQNTDYTYSVVHNGNIAVFNADASASIASYTTAQSITFNSGTNDQVRLYLRNPNGTNGTFTFEEVTLNEGTTAQEFVANVKHIQNPVVVSYGKNLLPSFDNWTINSNAVGIATINAPYELEFNKSTTSASSVTSPSIQVLPSTELTIEDIGNHGFRIYQSPDGSSWTKTHDPTTSPRTFTTLTTTKYLLVEAYVSGLTGTFTFTNPQLELGSTATTFTPQNETYLYGEDVKLGSNLGGTVVDKVYYSQANNGFEVLKRWEKDVVLDSSLAWSYGADFSGYKTVFISFAGVEDSQTVVKYDGSILVVVATSASFTGANQSNSDGGFIRISISDTDSGWGETYSPIADEIKAYFNGWKADTVDVNGKPTSWVSIVDGTTQPTTDTLAYVSSNKATDYTPYSLTYQLKNSVVEPVTMEGGLTLTEGLNQVELTTGSLDEIVTFDANNQANTVERSARVLQVYKNGSPVPFKTYTSGGEELPELIGTVDDTATYKVRFIALDKYLFTSNPVNAEGTYQKNLKSVVDKHTDQIADINTKQSIQDIWNDAVAVKGEGEKMQNGFTDVSISGANNGAVGVTFKKAYASKPKVVASSNTSSLYNIAPYNVTTTGFTMGVRHVDGTAVTATVETSWMAIGK